jgi:hypothetical protein
MALLGTACTQRENYPSPQGYDLNKPEKYNMPESLHEISGIAFHHNKADTMFAEQDEEGELFYFKPGSTDVKQVKFGKAGDYEDVAISNNTVIMLRSDGVLFTFPLNLSSAGITKVNKWTGLLPAGEYEGMHADDNGAIHVLCKHCSFDKAPKTATVFSFRLIGDSVKKDSQFKIDVKQIEERAGLKKMTFHPSGLSKNPLTNEWYILSSVNRLIVVTDNNWNVKLTYDLNPALFGQPEGIAFDDQNNLYISNEGDKISPGNVFKFTYTK